MAEWTEARKQIVMDKYAKAEPTADNSTEIVKEIAEELEESPNGVRMILMQAGVYIKKGAAKETKSGQPKKEGDKAPRVSKESQIAALAEKLEELGHTADLEILDKLTGKAAVYFLGLFSK